MEELINEIAKKNNTTSDAVRQEMQKAIDHAWLKNGEICNMFDAKPTPEQFIIEMSMGIIKRIKH
ncbi:MAG: sporulation initiation factor Spo0A C-terminal domain-containing protein [Firmicutes bacterium]|nr:sporulation initiation factor Spo0A C-terminal domain-containing protein [Bacillota bacterium]